MKKENTQAKNVFSREEQIQNLIVYYYKYRELVTLHREFGFGTAPRLSEGFTECLCKNLFGFEKVSGVNREYDLLNPLNNHCIEVKATTEDSGSTTINPYAKFDVLYWISFRIDFNGLWVREIPYENFDEIHRLESKSKRMNIQLKQFIKKDHPKKIYKICNIENRISEISVQEYLGEIAKKKTGLDESF